MPAAMPSLRLYGIALISHSRNGVTEITRNSAPERNTTASASCQLPPSSGTMVKAK